MKKHNKMPRTHYHEIPSPYGMCVVGVETGQIVWLAFAKEDPKSLTSCLYQMQLQLSCGLLDGNPTFIAEDKKLLEDLQKSLEDPTCMTLFSLRFPPSSTDLQRAVWRALMNIPVGQTVSYQQIAQAIGRPKAIRAVASAIGRNPISYIVPCHRVIHKDGTLSDYRWGKDVKAAILAKEGVKLK